jgi:hypothetical protein
MDANKIWGEICFILSDNLKNDISEKDFETQIIRAVEKLGWSEYAGEIKRQPELQIGHGKVRPDVVIYAQNGRALVAIEVKRPSEGEFKEESSNQLISYMLQLKAEFGLLIGSSIRLYYDGEQNPQQKPLLLRRIAFEKDDEMGSVLVSIFQKDDFLNGKYKSHIKDLINKFTDDRNIKKLKERLVTDETKKVIFDFLRTKFSEYGTDVVDGALRDLAINLSYQKIETGTQSPVTSQGYIDSPENMYETVFNAIYQNPNGISKSDLVRLTGFASKKITNLVYKLTKRGAVVAKKRGVYVAITKSIPPKVKRTTTKSPKAPPTSKPADIYATTKIPAGTMRDNVYNEIKNHPEGCTRQDIQDKIGLGSKQVSNAIHYLKKRGFIESIGRNQFVAKIH